MSKQLAGRQAAAILGAVVLACSLAMGESPYAVAWKRQLGTWTDDYSRSVVVDGAGNAFISGYTRGSLGGPNAGSYDAFLTKYDLDGNLLWTRQLGTSQADFSYSVAVDGAGNPFISGWTRGSLGGPNAGNDDAFLTKYDSDGNLLWTEQLGTPNYDYSCSVAVDGAGNAFISGYTSGSLGGTNAGSTDAFVTKYDSDGNLLWTQQLGTSGSDYSYSVGVDGAGNAFISGYTSGSLGGPKPGREDVFLSKYDAEGNALWTRLLGTTRYDYGFGVAVEGTGGAYITGHTTGSLGGPNAGSYDAFLSKYDAEGNAVWTRQLGTTTNDYSLGVAVDAAGNAYISGYTWGSLGGPNAGSHDAFVSKYDTEGNLLWTHQLGTASSDRSFGVAVDAIGDVYISGCTWGSLGGPNAGSGDAFLVKFAAPMLLVNIDIKPNSEVNAFNLKSKGVVPVAVLGAEDFDVNQIDLSTATLDGASPRTRGQSGNDGSFQDINGDSIVDLILHFDMRDMNIDPLASTLILTGELLDGTAFEGSDVIRIVPPGDMDGDGLLTTDDISLFVLALADGDAYLAYWGLDANIPGDCDGDGVLTADDIHSFVDLLTGRAGSAIPEPAMLAMFCGAAVPILSGLKRRRKS